MCLLGQVYTAVVGRYTNAHANTGYTSQHSQSTRQ
jgi:hypothetical protein